MIIHRLIVPLTAAIVVACTGAASAQGAFPAPLPGQAAPQGGFPAPLPSQAGRPPASDPAFPPVNGGAPQASIGAPAAASPFPSAGAAPLAAAPSGPPTGGGPPDACMKGFMPLREEAEKRGKMIKAASDRHAPPAEACKLLGNFSQSEVKMIKFIEANASKCGIPAQVADQMKAGHKNTEAMQKKVCDIAQQAATRGPAGPSLSEVLGSSASVPEATPNVRKGGSTFDTLNGNVLSR